MQNWRRNDKVREELAPIIEPLVEGMDPDEAKRLRGDVLVKAVALRQRVRCVGGCVTCSEIGINPPLCDREQFNIPDDRVVTPYHGGGILN